MKQDLHIGALDFNAKKSDLRLSTAWTLFVQFAEKSALGIAVDHWTIAPSAGEVRETSHYIDLKF